MIKDKLSELLGFEPAEDLRRRILTEVRETKKDIREVAANYSADRFCVALIDDDGTFYSPKLNKRITPAEYRKIHPLGPFLIMTVYE